MSAADKLTTIAENVPKVYESGQENVRAQVEPINAELEKCLAGTSVEGQTWYDKFWETFQQNGNRTDYRFAFSGGGWNSNNFKPKYPIKLKDAYLERIFNESFFAVNLAEVFRENNVTLDFSDVTNASYLFYYCLSPRIPEVGADTITKANHMFGIAWMLVTIDKLIVAPNCDMSSAFFRCDALENITLENEIASSTWNFTGVHNLSRESIAHIIGKLSATSTGLSITFSNKSVVKAFGSVDSEEWQALVASKPNWTISLA